MKNNKQHSGYGTQKFTFWIWILIVIMMGWALIVPVLLSTDSVFLAQSSLRKYSEGQLCDNDVYSPNSFEFLDVEQTQQRLAQASAEILPLFSYSLNETLQSTARYEIFAKAWDTPSTTLEVISLMLGKAGITDSEQVVSRFSELSEMERQQMLMAVRDTLQQVLLLGIYKQSDIDFIRSEGYEKYELEELGSDEDSKSRDISSMMTTDTLEKNLSGWLSTYSVSIKGFQLVLLADTVRLLASANYLYDANATLLAQENAKNATPPVYISVTKGQRILTKDTVVTKNQLTLLAEMSKHRTSYSAPELAGRFIFLMIVTFVTLSVFLTFIPRSPRKYQYLMFCAVLIIISEVIEYFTYHWMQSSDYVFKDSLIPFVLAPLFVSLVSGKKRLGAVTSFLLGCYAILLPGASIMTFFFCVINGNICTFFFQHSNKRIDLLFHWLYACLACTFTEIAFCLFTGSGFAELLQIVGVLLLNVTLSLIVVNLLLSICESLFNLPTANRLNELVFSENPVLDRLAAAAQGTYNHSMSVSELSYEAAKVIGANAMLARVGGLYHDIGKMDYPEYFIENQEDENKQDDIKPSLSVAIIKSHVKTGIEKGRESGLPQEVLDIIGEHHGNDVIYYFYKKAQDQAKEGGTGLINESDYSYDGALPDSKEAAIVMLADCVEAASRTLKKPSSVKIEKLVHSIILGKIERDQLKESQLSLTDLDLIASCFAKSLVGRNHHRIDYPEESKSKAAPVENKEDGE